MRVVLPILFDALFVLFAVVVYGASATFAIGVAQAFWGATLWSRGLAAVAGYFAFIHAFIVVVGVVRWVVQPRLHLGYCKVGLNKHYVAWGLNSVFQGLFTTSFFDRQVHIIFYLRYFYYRAMGMKLRFNTVIGTRAIIRQAELIELGNKVVIGEMCALYGHVSPDGRKHFQGRIRVGDESLVGGHSNIAPDVEIGTRTVIGAHCKLWPGVRVGDDVNVGACSMICSGVRVPDGARILPGSLIREGTEMAAGEVWGGNPAARQERTPDGGKRRADLERGGTT